jgi:hypothetical protein
MEMKLLFSKFLSLLLGASIALFAGAGFAAPVSAADRVTIVQASPDQDPNTPPDCKKYPKDVRCKK